MPVRVEVDATSPGPALERIWAYHGYDEVNYTTTAPGKALLGTLGAIHTQVPRIRTHFLLNTGDGVPDLKWGSTNVYTEDANGQPVYDWTLMDGILDTMVAVGTLPFLEIAFMPQALSSAPASAPVKNSNVRLLNSACFYPPKDYDAWGRLIRDWATHLAGRYRDVESTWQWELWNEPDSGYWHAADRLAEYTKLYDYTEAALHQVLPNAVLGGPAVVDPGSSFFREFLEHCAGQGPVPANAVTGAPSTRLDLISFHAKGGVAIADGHVEMDLGNQLRLHQTGFSAVAGFPTLAGKPIVISEADPDGCAACTVADLPAFAYRNSPAYGAYEVAMMKRTLDLGARLGVKVGGVLTWAFLFDPNDPSYFPGYRALASQGIHLPVLNAFKLLGSLSGNRLPATSSGALPLDAILARGVRGQPDIDVMATRDDQRIQVLVWNYHDALVAADASAVALTVKVPAGFGARAMVSHQRVDGAHGDAYATWTAQGRPATPSAAQIAALEATMDPVMIEPPHAVAVSDGAVRLDFELPRFGISLFTLDPGPADPPRSAQGGGSGCACGTTPGASGTSGLGLGLLLFGAALRWRSVRCAREGRRRGGDRGSFQVRDSRV